MEDQKINFETAKLAKEKGFKINGFHLENIEKYTEDTLLYELPTQSLLQKWLREKHNIFAYCIPREFEKVSGKKIIRWGNNISIHKNKFSSTYEKALEMGLQEALKEIITT